jgi:hypothetical protein
LFKSRPIGIEQQLDIVLACHVLKKHRTAFVMSDYKIILYHTPKWRKRLVNKKMNFARSWRKTTIHGYRRTTHGEKGPFMEPAGQPANSHAAARFRGTFGSQISSPANFFYELSAMSCELYSPPFFSMSYQLWAVESRGAN